MEGVDGTQNTLKRGKKGTAGLSSQLRISRTLIVQTPLLHAKCRYDATVINRASVMTLVFVCRTTVHVHTNNALVWKPPAAVQLCTPRGLRSDVCESQRHFFVISATSHRYQQTNLHHSACSNSGRCLRLARYLPGFKRDGIVLC